MEITQMELITFGLEFFRCGLDKNSTCLFMKFEIRKRCVNVKH